MPTNPLKPCPFCGGNNLRINSDALGGRIECYECLSVYWKAEIVSEDDLINAWNRRPEDWKQASEAAAEAPDIISHPPHYETDGIECIDAMQITQGTAAVMDFCICNAFKYLWRFRRKGGLEDIKKAKWYLSKYIELQEANEDD